MITGSVGAILYGEPRLTNDMDLVVELSGESVDSLAAAFVPPDYYFPPREAVSSEIAARRQFTLIHVPSGSKVDFIARKDTDFARCEFGRRRRVVFSEALDAVSATPEDIIVAKLRSYASGGSQKHVEDIRGILKVSGHLLDLSYVQDWVERLGLTTIWEGVQAKGERGP